MKFQANYSGIFASRTPRKTYRLKQTLAQAAVSEAAVDLLRELVLGQQAERPLTIRIVPRWAATAMEAAHHG